MKPLFVLVGFAACLCVAAAAAGAESPVAPDPASSAIRERLGAQTVAGERLLSPTNVKLFYGKREHRPAWIRGGWLSTQSDVLLAALRSADREGLRPADYHAAAIEALVARVRHDDRGTATTAGGTVGGDLFDLDLLLSDAFFLYASHLTAGRVKPESVEPEWNIVGRGRDLVFLLASALEHGHLAGTLEALPPQREDYRRLRDALASLRAIAAGGGWPLVPWGPALRESDRGPRVAALRQRLAASGELPAGADPHDELFDAPLAGALRGFQSRHGLDADAIAGRRTLAELNTPALQRVRQIEANLERLRWLPRDLGPRHLLVNVADFRLTLTEPGAPPLEMRVIVGRLARRTPFSPARSRASASTRPGPSRRGSRSRTSCR